jgi:hypothetical protein
MKNILRNLLILILGFLSIGAYYGGIIFIISPDGEFFQLPAKYLENSLFTSYLIPGIILLIVFAIMPNVVIYALLKKPQWKVFEVLNLIPDHHFSWTFSIYTGLGLIIWINVQTLIINMVDMIHTVYSSLGILIVCVCLLPGLRNKYYLKSQ